MIVVIALCLKYRFISSSPCYWLNKLAAVYLESIRLSSMCVATPSQNRSLDAKPAQRVKTLTVASG